MHEATHSIKCSGACTTLRIGKIDRAAQSLLILLLIDFTENALVFIHVEEEVVQEIKDVHA